MRLYIGLGVGFGLAFILCTFCTVAYCTWVCKKARPNCTCNPHKMCDDCLNCFAECGKECGSCMSGCFECLGEACLECWKKVFKGMVIIVCCPCASFIYIITCGLVNPFDYWKWTKTWSASLINWILCICTVWNANLTEYWKNLIIKASILFTCKENPFPYVVFQH